MKRLALALVFLLAAPALVLADTFERIDFVAPLSPSSEVRTPPITDKEIVGAGNVAMHLRRDTAGNVVSALVDFDVEVFTTQAETITAMHIHQNVAGANGGIVLSSTPANFPPSPILDASPGEGRIFKQRSLAITNTGELAAINGILANPAGYYLNLHSTSYPGGIIRGQLQRTVSTKVDSLDALVRRVAFLLGLRP
jgi:hypothetical protein